MTAKKKMYFTPGVISLVALMIFLKWVFDTFDLFEPKLSRIYQFNVPRDGKNAAYGFSIYQIEQYLRSKKQIEFILDEDEITNDKKFEIIKYEARKLKYTHDTSTVLRIRFTDDTNYGEFIRLVGLCYSDGHKKFILLNKSFVILGESNSRSGR